MMGLITWSQLIWISFPIPIVCLGLLSMPSFFPDRLVKFGANLASSLFFTKITLGPFRVGLAYVFLLTSIILFVNCCQSSLEGAYGHCPDCRHDSDWLWYKKAMRYRLQRNFWLSLFNTFLWFIVLKVYGQQTKILEQKNKISELNAMLTSEQVTGSSKKKA